MEWFNGTPNIVKTDRKTKWIRPMDDCNGEMKFTGTTWLSNPPGHHHTCTRCNVGLALRGDSYPKGNPNPKKELVPPELRFTPSTTPNIIIVEYNRVNEWWAIARIDRDDVGTKWWVKFLDDAELDADELSSVAHYMKGLK